MPRLKKLPLPPAPPSEMAAPPVPRLSLSVPEAAESTGLSQSYLYLAMKAGKLAFMKAGARRLIAVSELEAFLARLPHGPEAA